MTLNGTILTGDTFAAKGSKMELYIYSNETSEHVATIIGETNEACETKAEELYSSNDYSNTYSPAFGFASGLIENPNAKIIKARTPKDSEKTIGVEELPF